jgi:hypothetical protein
VKQNRVNGNCWPFEIATGGMVRTGRIGNRQSGVMGYTYGNDAVEQSNPKGWRTGSCLNAAGASHHALWGPDGRATVPSPHPAAGKPPLRMSRQERPCRLRNVHDTLQVQAKWRSRPGSVPSRYKQRRGRRCHSGTRRFRKTAPRHLAASDRPSGTVIQALRYLGPTQVTPQRLATLRQVLPPEARARLAKDAGLAPAWMRPSPAHPHRARL